ncbi:oligosaccharide flippase family protein [Macrococcus caseolyticus]|nr:oligosaccharide flippase family protein [Macrococcus caseolyticus]MDJ1088760.1 oligosaccharide flippase family protein [Macrococcus caseolyticus]
MVNILKDTIFYFLSKLLPSILTILNILIFIQFMDTNDYGKYSLLVITTGLINIFSTQWLRSSMLKFTVNYEQYNFYKKTQLYTIIFTSIITVIVSFILHIDFIFLILIILIQLSLSINEFYNNYFRLLLKPSIILIGNIIKSGSILLILVIIILFFKLTFVTAGIALWLSLNLSNIFYYFKVKNTNLPNISDSFDKKILFKKSLEYGFPLSVAFTSGTALVNLDKYLITFFLGINENGNYSMPFDTIHNFIYIIMGALGAASLPRLLKINDMNKLADRFYNYITYFYLINFPILILTLINSEYINIFFEKRGYNVNQLIIILITLSTFVHGTKSFIYDQAVQLISNTKYIYIPTVLGIVVTVVINTLFLEKYGIIVSAIGSLLSFTSCNLITYNILLKNTNLKFINRNILLIIVINILLLLMIFPILDDKFIIKIFVSVILVITTNVLIYLYIIRRSNI